MIINFKKYGDGKEIIVILHGLLGSLDNWHSVATELSKKFSVFTLDVRNHGKSPHSEEFNYEVMSDDLFHFFQEQNIISANLIGHSMGGKITMQFALSHSEKVQKLIVVDMSPKASTSTIHEELLNVLINFSIQNIYSRKEADEILAKQIPDFAIRQFLLKNLSRDESGNFIWKMNLPIIYKQYPNIAKEIKSVQPFPKPTLFIRGEKSSYIEENDVEAIKKLFSDVEILTIPKAGHWIHADAPKEFVTVVEKFIEK